MVDFILPWGFMKKCSLCKESKELECFTTKSGNVTAKCKECLSKLQKEWKKKNPDKAKKIMQREYQKNKERCDKSNNKWVEENRERSNEIKRNWKKRNREKVLEQSRDYANKRYAENTERELKRNKEWIKNNPEKQKESERKTKAKYPEKYKARIKSRDALKRGEIVRPTICSRCNEEGYIEGHHYDYNKPLDVIWLCKKCHAKEHKKN